MTTAPAASTLEYLPQNSAGSEKPLRWLLIFTLLWAISTTLDQYVPHAALWSFDFSEMSDSPIGSLLRNFYPKAMLLAYVALIVSVPLVLAKKNASRLIVRIACWILLAAPVIASLYYGIVYLKTYDASAAPPFGRFLGIFGPSIDIVFEMIRAAALPACLLLFLRKRDGVSIELPRVLPAVATCIALAIALWSLVPLLGSQERGWYREIFERLRYVSFTTDGVALLNSTVRLGLQIVTQFLIVIAAVIALATKMRTTRWLIVAACCDLLPSLLLLIDIACVLLNYFGEGNSWVNRGEHLITLRMINSFFVSILLGCKISFLLLIILYRPKAKPGGAERGRS